jgi:hypothetical protein
MSKWVCLKGQIVCYPCFCGNACRFAVYTGPIGFAVQFDRGYMKAEAGLCLAVQVDPCVRAHPTGQ